jgi:hypothetical protein
VSGGSEAELKNDWTACQLSQDVFLEEYNDFLRMGMAPYEIARAFSISMDTLNHRLKRYGLM